MGDQTKENERSETCSDQEENRNRYQVSVRKPEGGGGVNDSANLGVDRRIKVKPKTLTEF